MLRLNHREAQIIYEHAMKEYPKECCGVLLGNKEDRQVKEICKVRNADAKDRQDTHFLIDPLELYRVEMTAERKNMEIVGFYHSHTDCPAVPSEEDCRSMLPEYFYMIVSVVGGVCMEIKGYMKTALSGEVSEIKMDSMDGKAAQRLLIGGA